MAGELRQVVVDDACSNLDSGKGRVEVLELHAEAFFQIAVTNAHRVELLDTVQHGHHFFFIYIQFADQAGVNRANGGGQHAVGVDGVDHGGGDQPVAVRHRSQVQLPHQVVLQCGAGTVAGSEIAIVIFVVVAAAAGSTGLVVGVDVVPGTV